MAGRFIGPLPKFANSGLPLECGRNLDEIFQKLIDSTSGLNRTPGNPTEIQAKDVADPGTPSKAPALEDHVHPVDISGTPGVVGGLSAQGTGTGLAVTDHTHRIGVLTYKGDVLGFDGSNPVAVSVGKDGQALTADSTAASGVSWGDSAEDALLLALIGL
jgi:hypothetical protein